MTAHRQPFTVDKEAREARRQRRPARPRRRKYEQRDLETGEAITLAREYRPTPAEVEQRQFVSDLARSFVERIDFYKSPFGGEKPHALAAEEAEAFHADARAWLRAHPEGLQPERVTWGQIAALAQESMPASIALWARVGEAADDELASGRRAAEAAGRAATPWALAQFLSIRSAFADEWQPRGGIESAMVDMLTLTYSLYMHWTAVAHERATSTHDEQRAEVRRFDTRGWKSPHQSEAEAVEQAYRHADGYNRQFLRVLRQMRDLRRYAPPVIINQPGGQVNVGQQQVNLAK
jgi:hypothetical protein